MPAPLQRACPRYGCVHPQPCPEHGRKAQAKAHDDRRGSAASRGYNGQWRKYREWFFAELHRRDVDRAGLCGARLPGTIETSDSECALRGRIVPGRIVDHIRPATGPNDPTFFEPTNHQLLCDDCHNRKRARESGVARALSRVVVCGPPGSGKSTWVRHMAQPGDLVWDLDHVASTISYGGAPLTREQKGHLPWAAVTATLAMRDALLAWVATTTLRDASVYVIITDETEAERIAKRIGAMVHRCEQRAKSLPRNSLQLDVGGDSPATTTPASRV